MTDKAKQRAPKPSRPPKPKRRALPRSTDERQAKMQAILDHLQSSGDTITASATACGVPITTLYRWRREDQSFKAALKDAYDAGTDVLEQEAIRRGLHGVEKPVFYQGQETAKIREYSDTLLMFVLKKRNAAFRENTPGLEEKDPTPIGGFFISPDMFEALSPDLLDQMQQEFGEISRRKAAGLPPPKHEPKWKREWDERYNRSGSDGKPIKGDKPPTR